MSAAGRGADRDPLDYYETPAHAVEALLPFLPCKSVVDAGCGSGAISRVLGTTTWNGEIVGVDIDGRHRAEAKQWVSTFVEADFVAPELFCSPKRFDGWLAVSNPPYALAREFIDRMRQLVGPTGHVAALVRLGFLASRKRRDWWHQNPCDVVVLSERPSFCWSWTYRLECGSCGERYKRTRSTRPDAAAPEPLAWAAHCESDGVVHPFKVLRVSKCTTDATDYCWALFGPGPRGTWRVV